MNIVNVADLPSDILGKTWREKNSELKHNIQIGALVEIDRDDKESEQHGVRMFVVMHGRDCDQTPLYVLSANKDAVENNKKNNLIDKMHYGYPEYSLTVIKRRV